MSISILEQYLQTGNTHSLDLLLREQPDLVTKATSHKISPLLLACYYGKPQIVQIILRQIKSITIHEACAIGLYSQVEAMIRQIPSIVNEYSAHGLTPLAVATQFAKDDLVKLLLTNKADPNQPSQDPQEKYPIHTAVQGNMDLITKYLVLADADVNAQQKNGYSPLHLAAVNGNIDLIILLLEHEADVKLQNDKYQTAADLANEKGFNDIAQILKV
ncbi:ankyrin repeat domain-containing protein [Sphingobacteriaceae bacterium WQ 2009]|uniref:Ankyrin repeat domain-containing protein n=1 Tax=Rhinopithecimicrobium faecis TaxID=2820698 RepID=A0A8T4HB97_9SPHI|nr:ankyrin repeat domain-containing protein [Sphingobacteriaceae bacterium WQ 2009]